MHCQKPVDWGILKESQGLSAYPRLLSSVHFVTPNRCAWPSTGRTAISSHHNEPWSNTLVAPPAPCETPNMSCLKSLFRNPTLRRYLLGHLLILIGAYLMEVTKSMLPMALAASAALMLMVPLLRQLGGRYAKARSSGSRER